MDHYEVEDPVLLDTFSVDSAGRITIGTEFADKKVKVCVVDVSEK